MLTPLPCCQFCVAPPDSQCKDAVLRALKKITAASCMKKFCRKKHFYYGKTNDLVVFVIEIIREKMHFGRGNTLYLSWDGQLKRNHLFSYH